MTTSAPAVPAVFNFADNLPLRVTTDEHGELWFVAADVCAAIEIQNVTQAVARLDEDERSMFNIGRQGDAIHVNESGLYSLILGSRKAEAKKFKRWVTSEVLPTIRKTGKYEVPQAPTITPAQQRQLQDAIAARFPDGKQRPYAWSRFNKHFQLGSYKQLPADQTDEALAYIAQMPNSDGSPRPGELNEYAMAQLQSARFCLHFNEQGRMLLMDIPADAVMVTAQQLPKLLADPGCAAFRRADMPDIIAAAATRLKKAA
ncbi:BRO family protein [Chitinilyticum litopenaei]|uniref:BRO family protein n=1 Tax=Chitinilyticum litopenaei TaxID=1121276 RepID=UPI000418BE25|nr:BRO family protein [Chitinilyticum litopenaei]